MWPLFNGHTRRGPGKVRMWFEMTPIHLKTFISLSHFIIFRKVARMGIIDKMLEKTLTCWPFSLLFLVCNKTTMCYDWFMKHLREIVIQKFICVSKTATRLCDNKTYHQLSCTSWMWYVCLTEKQCTREWFSELVI